MSDEPDPPGSAQANPFTGPGWDEPGERRLVAVGDAGNGDRSVRPVRISRRRHGRRRLLGWALLAAGGIVLGGGIWIVITGLFARSELNSARADVTRLRAQISAGQLAAARTTAAHLAAHAGRAHWLTTGPAWALAAWLPGGEPLRSARGIAAAVDHVGADALPQLVRASQHIEPAELRDAAGRTDLDRIAAAAPSLRHAYQTVQSAATAVAALPSATWLRPIDTARTQLLAQLASLQHDVHSASLAAHVIPPMLGADGPKRYFVAFQNDAEARGTGGLPGGFAIVTAEHGTISFTHFGSDSELTHVTADVSFGPTYDQLYGGAGTTTMYGNANLSPNFPYAAQIWASMWQRHGGQHVDGVLALDPTALSYLLRATGPARLPDGSTVSAANVVALTQSVAYARFGTDERARKAYLLDIARAVSERIVGAHADTAALVRAAATAAAQRRLLVWSADPALESEIGRTAVSGIIPETTAPYVGLSIVNDGGNKLDYYLDRSLTWTRTGCGAVRTVTASIRLTNNAPASGLPHDVTSRSDKHAYPTKPGDNRLEVSYYATTGALMDAVTIDRRPTTARVGSERGHPVYVVDLELPRGTSRTIVLQLREPAGTGDPVVLRQPLVRPLAVHLHDTRCR